MSIRQKIEDALQATPNITLDELRKQLPDIKPGSLKADFYKLKRKLSGPKTKKKSARLLVAEYLNKNPDAIFDVLQSAFPDVKPVTLRNYLSESKKATKSDTTKAKSAKKPVRAKSEPAKKKSKKKSVQQQVSDYLDKNQGTSFDTLKSAFPDIKNSSLSAYKSLWKKTHEPDKQDKQEKSTAKQPGKSVTKKKQLDKIAKPGKPKAKQTSELVKKKDKPVKETILDKPVRKDDTDLIQSLKETIAAQEKTIQTLNKTIELLNPESEVALKGLTQSEIKRVAVTYLKSIKELPAKLRG
jgi:hypothetical protein